MTPPHSAGMYNLFVFFLFGILFASRCSRLRSTIAMLSAVHRGVALALRFPCDLLCACWWGWA